MVFSQSQQNWVVEEAAVSVGDQDVFALAYSHGRQITRGQHLNELGSVRSGDLDLTFNGDVAEDRVVHEVPEVLHWIAEIARNIHVVIHRKSLSAPPHGCVEIGGFANLGAKAEVIRLHCFILPDRRQFPLPRCSGQNI